MGLPRWACGDGLAAMGSPQSLHRPFVELRLLGLAANVAALFGPDGTANVSLGRSRFRLFHPPGLISTGGT